jgi:hypothetical protein
MSDSADFGFGKFVPGFDFLQNLAKGAAGSIPQMPNLANWVSPSLNLEELEKRVDELKAVHFWLDQNSKALGATIQALEVQKMTLATLKGMNFNLGDVANALKLKAADSVVSGAQKISDRVSERAASTAKTLSDVASSVSDGAKSMASAAAASASGKSSKKASASSAGSSSGLGGLVDPMQLWSSLTQQFQQIAAGAMKDAAKNTALDVTKNMASGLAKEAIKATRKAVTPKAKPAASKKAAAKAVRRR